VAKHSLGIQIQEVERELRMRRQVYDRQTRKGAMRPGEASELISRMESVLETLRDLQRLEDKE
jgi:hypothetical protein